MENHRTPWSNATARRASATGLALGLTLAFTLSPRQARAACGDGTIEGADVCDDGNSLDGDGCSASCTVEPDFDCRVQRSTMIVNGSFDTFPTGLGGWTLASGDFDWVDGTAAGGCQGPSGDGTRHVDMNGFTRGQLYQDITTVPGERVVVTFLGSANCILLGGEPCDTRCTKRLTVSVSDTADPTSTAFATSVYDLDGQPRAVGWSLRRFEFVARTAMTRLTFTGSDPNAAGPFLDRVRVAESVCDPRTCGDGTVGAGETCDDGNTRSGDGCSAVCSLELGWMCATPGMACAGRCGDGFVVATEACDDGDTTSGDGCSDRCEVEPGYACALDPFSNTSVCVMSCGNGTLEAGEVCDDGNAVDTDACSNTCLRGPGEPCLTDPQCALVPRCALSTCAGCYDTAPAGGRDFGCSASTPACDVAGATPSCVECLEDADCAMAERCVLRACVPVGMDAGPLPDAAVSPDAATNPDAATAPDGAVARDAAMDPDAAAGLDVGPAPIDAGPRIGGASGGACVCGASRAPAGPPWLVCAGVIVLAAAQRRRRGARR